MRVPGLYVFSAWVHTRYDGAREPLLEERLQLRSVHLSGGKSVWSLATQTIVMESVWLSRPTESVLDWWTADFPEWCRVRSDTALVARTLTRIDHGSQLMGLAVMLARRHTIPAIPINHKEDNHDRPARHDDQRD
jgi:hypothetical protein